MSAELLTRAELGTALKVSQDTIQRYVRAGRITAIPIGRGGRFHLESVLAQLKEAPKRKRRAGRINP